MSKLLCYTSPARGHLYPTVPVLLEAQRRGHEVHVRTLSDEVSRMRGLGFDAQPIAAEIEAISHDDWQTRSPAEALARAVRVLLDRAEHELADLANAIEAVRPNALLIDFNAWGAAALAESSGLAWALFMPYFLPWRLRGLPPFGPGLAPRSGWSGQLRDAVIGAGVDWVVNRSLPGLNALRARVQLPPLAHAHEYGRQAPHVLYFTAEPFEYRCVERPANVHMVGPCCWEPPSSPPPWLADVERPLVLVSCSTEFQNDDVLIRSALEALAQEDVFVVATGPSVAQDLLEAPGNARVERFLSHGQLLGRADVVVSHGGMGITQKALAAGVPVCVVPFGRDQHEVARHVEVAEAGARLPSQRLSPQRLRKAIADARGCRPGAARVAEGFRQAGGAIAAADVLDELLSGVSARPRGDAMRLRA